MAENKITQATEWLNEKLYPILGPPPLGPADNDEERRQNENGEYPQRPESEASDEAALHSHPGPDGQLPDDAEPAHEGETPDREDSGAEGHYPANVHPDESQHPDLANPQGGEE